MMPYTVGLDLVEIDRIRRSMGQPRFLERVFSPAERELFASRSFSPQTVAANFCAKEAFAKALGTGVRGFWLTEVSLLRDKLGKPFLVLEGRAAEIARREGLDFSVSVTHTREYASAVVIGWRKRFFLLRRSSLPWRKQSFVGGNRIVQPENR